jgi:hypothetical protein
MVTFSRRYQVRVFAFVGKSLKYATNSTNTDVCLFRLSNTPAGFNNARYWKPVAITYASLPSWSVSAPTAIF